MTVKPQIYYADAIKNQNGRLAARRQRKVNMFSLTKWNIQDGILRQKEQQQKKATILCALSILFTDMGEDTEDYRFWYVGSFSQNAFIDGIT